MQEEKNETFIKISQLDYYYYILYNVELNVLTNKKYDKFILRLRTPTANENQREKRKNKPNKKSDAELRETTGL